MDLQRIHRSTRSCIQIRLLAVLLCWVLLGVAKAGAQVPMTSADDPAAAPAAAWLTHCDAGVAADCRKLGEAYLEGRGKARNRAIAALLFEEACKGGDFEACFRRGEQYAGFNGVGTDYVRAVQHYRKACDGGFPEGCVGLAVRYFLGQGVPKDKAKGEALLAEACNRGGSKPCDELARRYIGGFGVDQQKERGVALYAQSCAAGAGASCRALGDFYRGGQNTIPDQEKAAMFFARACDAGDAYGCIDEAEAYRVVQSSGNNIIQDISRLVSSLARACNLGNADGCDMLGKMLYAGTEIAGDRPRATDLFDRACSLDEAKCDKYRLIKEEAGLDRGCTDGNRNDCVTLGALYANESAPGFNLGLSDKAYAKACDLRDAGSCRYLGEVYRDGSEVVQNKMLAARLLGKACDLGDPSGCDSLGRMHYTGDGVARDNMKALRLFDQACALSQGLCENFRIVKDGAQLASACDGGAADQCAELARLYGMPDVVGSDRASEEQALGKACEGGIAASCKTLGDDSYSGTLDTRDPARAAFWYRKGCDGGNVEACFALAGRYENGVGVIASRRDAFRLFQRACALGEQKACNKRDEYAALDPDLPIADADTAHVPPLEPRAAVHQKGLTCRVDEQEFRGKRYSDSECNSYYALHGYAVKPGSAPWQALIRRPPQLHFSNTVGMTTLPPGQRVACGGSLVAKGWILTAAHCLYDHGQDMVKAGYRIILGAYNIADDKEGVSYPILKIIPHKDFIKGDPRFANDIALIQYDVRSGQTLGPVQSIRAIPLDSAPVGKRRIADGMFAYIYGWGYTEEDKPSVSNTLRGVKMELKSEPECTRITGFTGQRANIALCAAGRKGEQACYGDSGGGLIYYGDADRIPRVIGVVSAGKKCGTTGRPSQYTRVSASLDWILPIITAATPQR